MKTPPRQASRSHHRPRREQTSSEVGRLSPVAIMSPCPRPCRHWYAIHGVMLGRVAAELARNRSEHSRLARFQVDERALEHAVVVAGPARRIAFGERARDIAAIPCERCCTDRCARRDGRPGSPRTRIPSATRSSATFGPCRYATLPRACWKQASSLQPDSLRVVRDEAPRHRMQWRRHSRRRSAVLAEDGKRERRVGQHEDDEKADDRASARDPLSPEHPSNT